MRCRVPRQTGRPGGDVHWDKFPWKEIPSWRLENYMGKKPDHFPKAEVKIAYDEMSIHLMFQVADRYVRAIALDHQDNVWEDSCVEFFFTPNLDVTTGYFNLEMNCGGTLLFHFQPGSGQDRIVIPKKDCDNIRVAHSLPRIVDPEIQEPLTWRVAYSIPFVLLKRYCPVMLPGPGGQWRANFYKCADKTSHPHWLTWAKVDFPRPNFHLPQFFGILEFQ
jgi:Carbohydrate-binding family 9